MNDQAHPFPPSILVQRIAGVDDIKQYVVEQRLEGGNAVALLDQERSQRVCARNTDSQYLTEGQDEPKIPRLEEGKFLPPCLFLARGGHTARTGCEHLGVSVVHWGLDARGSSAVIAVDAGGSHSVIDGFGITHIDGRRSRCAGQIDRCHTKISGTRIGALWG